MTISKNMTNLEIFNLANLLLENFDLNKNQNFPVKISFFLYKNINNIVEMAREIESSRIDIIKKYGHLDETDTSSTQYVIDPEDLDIANDELKDLFNLTQDVKINMLNLDWFDGVNLSNAQVNAISFMISED